MTKGNTDDTPEDFVSDEIVADENSRLGSLPERGMPHPAKQSLFEIDLPTFDRRDLHWHAPASFIVYRDGTWSTFASRIANNLPWNGGYRRYTLYIEARYSETRGGTVLYSNKYILETLSIDQAYNAFYTEGFDSNLVPYLGRVKWISVKQWYAPGYV